MLRSGGPLSPSALSLQVLHRDLLDSLPQQLKRRPEVLILRHALAGGGTWEGAERSRARHLYAATLTANLRALSILDEVLERARAEQLSLVILKGALLSRTHYGDPGARPMADLDLLCRPEELRRAVALFETLGFSTAPHPAHKEAQGLVHDVRLAKGSVLVELHFQLWHECGIRGDARWLHEGAREIPFGRGAALAPREIDHLYVVLVHAALHGFAGNPLWFADAALLAHGLDPGAWQLLEHRATLDGATVALAAARDHLHTLIAGIAAPSRRGPALLRRAFLRQIAPWLQRGERPSTFTRSRVVRPLLFERPTHLLRWGRQKVRLLLAR